MKVGQKVNIKRNKAWLRCPEILSGVIVYENKHYITVRTTKGYCETILKADFLTGEAVAVKSA